MKICSICQKQFTEFGNNAWPVNNGRCCNSCNWSVVIQARVARLNVIKRMAEKSEEGKE